MYLWKQWRESRIISALALLGLVLLFALVMKGIFAVESHPGSGNAQSGFAQFFVFIFYAQAALIGGWAWLVGSIGAGKNLGEESGSFLFTRPRARAWFLWHDWAFGMAMVALVTVLSNLILLFFCYRLMALTHVAQAIVRFPQSDTTAAVPALSLLITAGVFLFAGLVYSLTYASTIVVKRTSGVILGAGLFAGYLVLGALITHYYPDVHLPSPILTLFHFGNHQLYGLSNHLPLWIAVRTLVILLFPIAAQLTLNRTEI